MWDLLIILLAANEVGDIRLPGWQYDDLEEEEPVS
jgi:hypothetical protein